MQNDKDDSVVYLWPGDLPSKNVMDIVVAKKSTTITRLDYLVEMMRNGFSPHAIAVETAKDKTPFIE